MTEAYGRPNVQLYNCLICLQLVYLSGVISCNGEDGTTNVGGSSGGSVKLTTGTLNGKGRIEVNGGKGRQKK